MIAETDTTLAVETAHAYEQIRHSSDKLLARLVQHHDYSVRTPKIGVALANYLTIQEIESGELPVCAIQKAVGMAYNVSQEDILANFGSQKVVLARHIAMYLSRLLTTSSLHQIGREFNKMDHTSTVNAVEKIKARIMGEPAFAAEISMIVTALKQARMAA